MITIKVSDLREMVEQLEKEGIKYTNINYLEEEKFNGDIIATSLNFNAYDGLGSGMEFGDIENIRVDDLQKNKTKNK